ncbi:hypothetical protein LR48_Vigan01g187200 [Vigna angularis]|uniref:ABC transporter domain-containing protein n=2 Tax=Phaseolus angularis TaxID=3914 RepID=A0A0L9TPB9_PHAAN|nr:hypothetical protein LR48_Vigan01g187200 [Vigna angularis]
MAVLGASGSGKSTLIDALANRIAKGSLKGTVALNGETLESRLLKVISAYVMQDDLLFPMLTVEETLMFAAEFRLPRTLSKSKKNARVQALIEQLGLRNAAKTVIDDEGHRGVSGGERQRVSIGIDIIHDPILLFLDEPTSRLDSTSAFLVVKVLQRIAQSRSIVIMSIHQPSYRILGLLDRMIFLSWGQTVYSGSPSQLPVFFSEFGHPIPETDNKTEFALDLIRELEGSPGGTKSLVEFNKSWQSMTKHHQTTTEAERNGLSLKEAISESISRGKLVSGATNTNPNPSSMVPTFANPFWIEMATQSKRSFLNPNTTHFFNRVFPVVSFKRSVEGAEEMTIKPVVRVSEGKLVVKEQTILTGIQENVVETSTVEGIKWGIEVAKSLTFTPEPNGSGNGVIKCARREERCSGWWCLWQRPMPATTILVIQKKARPRAEGRAAANEAPPIKLQWSPLHSFMATSLSFCISPTTITTSRFKLYAMVVVVTTVTAPPTKIVNTERVGMALQDMDIVKDLLVRRGESVPLGFECPIMCV